MSKTTTKTKPTKIPVTFKCDPELLERFEQFRETLDYHLPLTAFIEGAMRRDLDRHKGGAPKR